MCAYKPRDIEVTLMAIKIIFHHLHVMPDHRGN